MANSFRRFMREITQSRKRRKDRAAVDVDAEGFVFTCRGRSTAMKWQELTKLTAGTYAMMWSEVLFVRIAGTAGEVEFDEFVDGFRNFEAAMLKEFPTVRVPFLALQTNSSRDDRLDLLWQTGDRR